MSSDKNYLPRDLKKLVEFANHYEAIGEDAARDGKYNEARSAYKSAAQVYKSLASAYAIESGNNKKLVDKSRQFKSRAEDLIRLSEQQVPLVNARQGVKDRGLEVATSASILLIISGIVLLASQFIMTGNIIGNSQNNFMLFPFVLIAAGIIVFLIGFFRKRFFKK